MKKINNINQISYKGIILKKSDPTKEPAKFPVEICQDLNLIPHYGVVPVKNPMLEGAIALEEFKNAYGTVKSATYIAQIIKNKTRQGVSSTEIDELMKLRRKYHAKIKIMRNELKKYGKIDKLTYCALLKQYVLENEAYINCQECSDLMLDIFQNKGIEAHEVLMYSTNNNSERTSKAEHVFVVFNLKDDYDISNPLSWGEDAIVCDPWANICMRAGDAIKFYGNLFNIEEAKDFMAFDEPDN